MKSADVGPKTANYTYDALGRRVSKQFSGRTTIFINDGLQEIAEYERPGFDSFALNVPAQILIESLPEFRLYELP